MIERIILEIELELKVKGISSDNETVKKLAEIGVEKIKNTKEINSLLKKNIELNKKIMAMREEIGL